MNMQNKRINNDSNTLPFSITLESSSETKDINKIHKDSAVHVLYITKGYLDIVIDFKIQKANTGDIIFINSNTPYAILKKYLSNFTFLHLTFLPEVVYAYGTEFFNIETFLWLAIKTHNPYYIHSTAEVGQEVSDLFKDTYKIYTKKAPGYEFAVHSNILFLSIRLYEKWCVKPSPQLDISNTDINLLKHIFSYIEESYLSLSYTEFAETFNLKQSFSKLFKKLTGYTISEYIEFHKLSEAMYMLVTTTKRVTELSYLLGYSSSAYFSKLFSAHTGMSPSKFRKTNNINTYLALTTNAEDGFKI